MKAYSLDGVNNFNYIDKKYPECPAGWAVVKVKAAGICSSDISRIFTKGTYHFPTVPGHEFSGIVDKVGRESDKKIIGKRVGVFPLIPCKKCTQCAMGHYEMCTNYDYVGSRRDGGFAEYVAVPVWNLVEFSDKVPFEEIALMEPLSVALHAMKQANIQTGDKVGIIGTGMIGFAAAQWAKKLGAKEVTIIGRSLGKKKIADTIQGIQYTIIDKVDKEYDVVLEAVGSNSAIEKAISIVKAAGVLVLMGNPEGNINLSQDSYWRILRKQMHLIGAWNSAYKNNAPCDWSEAKEALDNRSIQARSLISHTFTQDNLKEGLELMKNHSKTYCKIMTIWNDGK